MKDINEKSTTMNKLLLGLIFTILLCASCTNRGMEGWRRMDLIRRGADYFAAQVDKYNPFAKGNVQPYHAFYPIPTNEINMNDGIGAEDQNEGYK